MKEYVRVILRLRRALSMAPIVEFFRYQVSFKLMKS
jgi:hypothetical protein